MLLQASGRTNALRALLKAKQKWGPDFLRLANALSALYPNIKERTFTFALDIVRLCRSLDERPGIGRTLGHQLLRSRISIGANVEEAQAGQSQADFIA